jgi:phage-related minor tail protein
MAKEAKIYDFEDVDGYKLPKNISTQFRGLQGGVEYLKTSADNITTELKGVSKKLSKNETDLSAITHKVNEIDKNLKDLSKLVGSNFENIGKTFEVLINALTPKDKKK